MTLHPHKYWPALCNALGRPELIDDPRFESVAKRRENFRELIAIYDEAFSKLTWEQWDEKIHEHDLISCRVNSLTDLASDEQILANGYMQKLPHPDLAEWWYVPTPVNFEKTPISVRSAAPRLGENTDEILGELGYSEAQIRELRDGAVV
jgi:crotonobetainyl-CoA:carnitine CoA-transferase CaiB-like acyl-CoA transferase